MTAEPNPELTPLLRQYRQIKASYPDAILFFRLGDFYEMFFEDAVTASKILEIALTTRDKNKAQPVPLCGVPFHAVTPYVAKLIRAGHKVAICEQMEDPRQAKGIVRREVVRVVTPGTVLDAELLEAKDNNFLTALHLTPGMNRSQKVGLATVDLSTGEFHLAVADNTVEALLQETSRMDPREVLFPQGGSHPLLRKLELRRVFLHPAPSDLFDAEEGARTVRKQFGEEVLAEIETHDAAAAIPAAGALLRFLQETQKTALSHLTAFKIHRTGKTLGLDETAQRHLGLVSSRGSLFSLLDKTRTPMGGRMLRLWILHPLLDPEEIRLRHQGLEELLDHFSLRMKLREVLDGISDMERLIARTALKTALPRDLTALARSLAPLPFLMQLLADSKAQRIRGWVEQLSSLLPPLSRLRERLERGLTDPPPATIGDGGVIREGYSSELDSLREISREGKGWIARLEASERTRTGIDSLKIRHNRVFGYYIEISRSRMKNLPDEYIRKQTLSNAERFITPELKEYEEKVLGAEDRCRELEGRLFEEIREAAATEVRPIQRAARIVAELDVLTALAECAHLHHYVKPNIHEGSELRILEGRHPVVERMSPMDRFVPNDTEMDSEDKQILILTGPNMAGKSTYMRQVALIVLMAQMGSFVPAREASIGVVDRIFTRIGASDNLVEGRSTFMVEMEEAAEILRYATSKSLVLLDEIGRGTSTFDGISIAWAVAEYLRRKNRSKTLFATHYHELTELALVEPGICNARMLVREWNDDVIFLRKVAEGPADKSYGIAVARLAGLPPEVISRAKELLANLEAAALDDLGTPSLSRSLTGKRRKERDPEGDQPQIPLFQPPPHPVLAELSTLDPMRITPLEALAKLEEWKRRLSED